jgi:hypothetical protein
MDRWVDGLMDGWMNRWVYGWMDRWVDEWIDQRGYNGFIHPSYSSRVKLAHASA